MVSTTTSSPHKPIPSPSEIETSLRTNVQHIYNSGNLKDLTIKRIRKAVELELGLPNGWLRAGDGDGGKKGWKERSEVLIRKEVDRLDGGGGAGGSEVKSPDKRKVPVDVQTLKKKKKEKKVERQGSKRFKAEKVVKARKKREASITPAPEGEESALSDAPAKHQGGDSESDERPPSGRKIAKVKAKSDKKSSEKKPAPPRARIGKRKVVDSDEEDEEGEDEDKDKDVSPDEKTAIDSDAEMQNDEPPVPPSRLDETSGTPQKPAVTVPPCMDIAKPDASESDMSSIIDEGPRPKKKRQKKNPTEDSSKTAKPTKKTKTAPDMSSDEMEIKRLQGWLVKCGIRKLWGVELKPFDSPKAKIKHLKEMLSDVGMDGRYSVEKAAAIKERRELAAELEAVQEFGQRWGEGKRASRSARRAPIVATVEVEEGSGGSQDDESDEAASDGGSSADSDEDSGGESKSGKTRAESSEEDSE